MIIKKWIGNNLSLGGLSKNTLKATGKVLKCSITGVGLLAKNTGTDNGKKIHHLCQDGGNLVDRAFERTGELIGFIIDGSVRTIGLAGGTIASAVATLCNCDKETVDDVKKIGTFATTIGVGIAVGVGLGGIAISMAAATGTSGAAATTSGLAAIGGGSLASGGGGMAAGQAVLSTLTTASAGSTTAALFSEE